jgi:DNA polymerase IIIc chi subunit
VRSVVFYELPSGEYWDGLARLVSHLLPRGKSAVVVGSMEEASSLSRSLWSMSHAEMVPHGIRGVDEDEDLDLVIIAVSSYDGPREILILASPSEITEVLPCDLVIEPVPQEATKKQRSRSRYRRYRETGHDPAFVSWTQWTGSEPTEGW